MGSGLEVGGAHPTKGCGDPMDVFKYNGNRRRNCWEVIGSNSLRNDNNSFRASNYVLGSVQGSVDILSLSLTGNL